MLTDTAVSQNNMHRWEGIKRCNFAQTRMPEPELHCERQLRGGSVAKAKDSLHFQGQLKHTTTSSETIELKDKLSRTHFQAMATAVQKATTSEDSSRMKAALKISLYYLLLKPAKFVRIKHLINENDTI